MSELFGKSISEFFASGTNYSFRLILAILIFVIGWIIAKIISKIVKQIILTSDLEQKIAKLFGVDVHERGLEAKKQISLVLEKIVYLFFVLIALLFSLQMLGDEVISGILKAIFEKVGIALPDILKAFLIIAVAWAIASIVRFVIVSGLTRIRIGERLAIIFPEEEAKSLEKFFDNIGSFVFYLILLIAMMPFFEALKMSSLVAPLRSLFDKIFSYLPNLFTGVMVLIFGFFIARLVQKIVTNLTESAGVNRYIESLPFDTVLKSLDFAKMIGTIAFLFVMVPVVAVSFETMQIDILTNVLGTFMNKFAYYLPNIIVAFFLFIIGLVVARFLGDMSANILFNLGFDKLLMSIGAEDIEKKLSKKEGKLSLSRVGGNLVAIVILIVFLMEAFEIMHFDLLANALDKLILYVPHILVAFILISLGFYLAKVLEDFVRKSFPQEKSFEADIIGLGLRYGVIVLSFFMAFDQLKIAHTIVSATFIILLGTVGLTLALAFGLGGQSAAQKYIEHIKEEYKKKKEE